MILLNTVIISMILTYTLYRLRGAQEYSRIRDYGGSILLNTHLMHYGYWVLHKAAALCIRLGLSANMISVLNFVFMMISAIFLSHAWFQAAGLFYILSISCDSLDGIVARQTRTDSQAGMVIDGTLDRLSDIIICIAFIILFRNHTYEFLMSMFALSGSFMVSYVTAKSDILRISIPRGLMRRVERTVYIGTAILLTPLADTLLARAGYGALAERHILMGLALTLIAVIANFSAMHRIIVLYFRVKSMEVRGSE